MAVRERTRYLGLAESLSWEEFLAKCGYVEPAPLQVRDQL